MTAVRLRAPFEDYLRCLKEERYFDAHEVLEALWFPRRFEKSSEVKLLRGLINAAVSFELIKRGRRDASRRVWKNYLKYRPLVGRIAADDRPDYRILVREVEKIRQRDGRLSVTCFVQNKGSLIHKSRKSLSPFQGGE